MTASGGPWEPCRPGPCFSSPFAHPSLLKAMIGMNEKNAPLNRKELTLITPVFRPFLCQEDITHGRSKPLRNCLCCCKRRCVQPSWVAVAKMMPSERHWEVLLPFIPSFTVCSRLPMLLWSLSWPLPLVQHRLLIPPGVWTEPPPSPTSHHDILCLVLVGWESQPGLLPSPLQPSVPPSLSPPRLFPSPQASLQCLGGQPFTPREMPSLPPPGPAAEDAL